MNGWMDGWTLVSLFCWMGFWICGFGERFCQSFVVFETNERREEDNRASKSVGLCVVECTMGWSQGAFILGTPCSEGVTRHKGSGQKKL